MEGLLSYKQNYSFVSTYYTVLRATMTQSESKAILLGLFVCSSWLYVCGGTCVPATNVSCPDVCICQYCDLPWPIKRLRVSCDSKKLNSVPQDIPLETVSLNLAKNNIGMLRRPGEISYLKNLYRLDLSYNQLDSNNIHSKTFDGLVELNNLILKFNRALKIIPNEWFRTLKNLWKVDLERAHVETISEDAFRFNTKLRFIVLRDNQIKTIEPGLFQNLPSLEKVLLQTNQLKYLPPDMFNGSVNTDELNVYNNKLTTISSDTGLQYMENLKRLSVYQNPLDCGCDLVWFRQWIGTNDVIVKPHNTTCASGVNLMKFNPDDLQCEFSVAMVTVSATMAFLILCLLITVLFSIRWRIRYKLYLLKLFCKGYIPIGHQEEPIGEYKYDIFISHSRKDENWVLNVLRPTLENPPYNYKLCLDFRDFIVGSCISENIIDAINESRKTAFVVTKDFIESEWCYFELEMVRQKMFEEHRDIAILILKEDVPANKMPGLLQYLMRRGNHIEWSDNRQGQKLFWKKMENSVKNTAINMEDTSRSRPEEDCIDILRKKCAFLYQFNSALTPVYINTKVTCAARTTQKSHASSKSRGYPQPGVISRSGVSVLYTIGSQTTDPYCQDISGLASLQVFVLLLFENTHSNGSVRAKYRNKMKLAGYMLCVLVFCRLSYAQGHGCVPAKNVTCPSICICQMCNSPKPAKRLWVDCGFKKLTSVPAKIPHETWSLDLSNNRIGRLNALAFSHLTNLTRLDLSYNLLDYNEMDSRIFEGLGNVDYLILKYNRAISTIKSEWFRPMYSMSKIDLQRANVEAISEDAFKHNINLRFVRLMENRINKIEPALFRNLPSLEKVLLQRNQLEYLPPDMFNGSKNTDELNVYNNRLTIISSSTGLQYMENLKRLSVYQNPLDCGCDLVWFRQWIDTNDVIVKPQNTTCASGVNLMKFNPEDLQCEFPVVMVTVAAAVGFLILCLLMTLLVTNRWRIRYRLYLLKLLCKGYIPIGDKEDPVGEYKYDIFISHSSKDENWVLNVLRPTLENPPYNYKLCLDFRDFIVGSCISENIIDAINESRKTAFVVTNEFIESEWCYFELEMVRQKMFEEHRDIAILILKEDVPANKMPGLLQYLMRRGNHIEWSDNRQGQKLFWKKMENSVKNTAINMA
ncbi:toll-like receptor Tollo [Ptychodera flava]|uniref:toll-like receptor Tollo n=1 Tax=Ptychodera flava TaxID=63121 RepID=UPI00396A6FF9